MVDETVRAGEPLRCPHCGATLEITLLELELRGGDERIFSLSCPKGDYRAAASEARVNQAVAEAMFAYLKCPPPNRRLLAS